MPRETKTHHTPHAHPRTQRTRATRATEPPRPANTKRAHARTTHHAHTHTHTKQCQDTSLNSGTYGAQARSPLPRPLFGREAARVERGRLVPSFSGILFALLCRSEGLSDPRTQCVRGVFLCSLKSHMSHARLFVRPKSFFFRPSRPAQRNFCIPRMECRIPRVVREYPGTFRELSVAKRAHWTLPNFQKTYRM